jgi:hypothetical protein
MAILVRHRLTTFAIKALLRSRLAERAAEPTTFDQAPLLKQALSPAEQIELAIQSTAPHVQKEIVEMLRVGELASAKGRLMDYVLSEHHHYEDHLKFEALRGDQLRIDNRMRIFLLTPWVIFMGLLTMWILS